MKTLQRGFTLIELIVVIVILGVLAAVALPKFVDIGGDARTSVITATDGSLRAANGLIYAKAAARGQIGTTTSASISVGNATIAVLGGFAATADELSRAMDLSANDFSLSGSQFLHSKATNPTGCGVTYAAPAIGNQYVPTYTLVTTGC